MKNVTIAVQDEVCAILKPQQIGEDVGRIRKAVGNAMKDHVETATVTVAGQDLNFQPGGESSPVKMGTLLDAVKAYLKDKDPDLQDSDELLQALRLATERVANHMQSAQGQTELAL